MTAEPISFTGTLSLEDLLDIHHYHSRILVRPVIQYLMRAVSLVFVGITITAGIYGGFTFNSAWVLAACAYFPFGWQWLDRRSVRRRYRRNLQHFIETTATFTDESVSTWNVEGDARLNWKQLKSVVDTPRGLLFLLPPHQIWFWLPRRVFREAEEVEAVLALAAEHQVEIRQMR